MGKRSWKTPSWGAAGARRPLPTSAARSASIGSPASFRVLRSWRARRSSGKLEHRVAIEMLFEMVGERVERTLDGLVIGEPGRRAERGEPGRALTVVGEQPMHIGAHDAPVGRHGPIGPPVGKAQERPRAIGTARLADMHLVAGEGRAVCDA